MTSTNETTATTAPSSPSGHSEVYIEDGQAFIDALRSAVVSADSGKNALPILASVHVEVDGPTITLTGTDRYQITRATVTLLDDSGMHFSAPLDAPAIVKALRSMPKRRTQHQTLFPVRITAENEHWTVEQVYEGTSARLPVVSGEFPRAVHRIGTQDPEAVEQIALNPRTLADLNKHVMEHKQAPVWTFRGPLKPASAEWEAYGVSYRYMVQPVRRAGID